MTLHYPKIISINPAKRAETVDEALECCRDLSLSIGVASWAAGSILRNSLGVENILKSDSSLINYANLCYELSKRNDLSADYVTGIVNVAQNYVGEFTQDLAQHLLTDLPRRWNAKEKLSLYLLRPDAWSGQAVCVNNGNYGIANWVSDCVTTRHSPLELAKLSLKLQRVPTMDFAVLDTNRSDARALGHIFTGMHSFVHRQHVKTHQVLEAMLAFHESNGDDFKKTQLRAAIRGTPLADCAEVFDLRAYERVFFVNGIKYGQALDFLSRLYKNTGFDTLPVPTGLGEELGSAIQLLSKGKGEDLRPFFNEAFKIINSQALELLNTQKFGISPELVQAVVWLDFQASCYLSQIYYEEQLSLHRQPWFHQLLKFRELFASASSFDSNEFEDWQQQVEFSSSARARSLIGHRALMRVKGIADELTGTPIESLRGMFNSAGSSDNFLGTLSAFLQPASSKAGERFRQEELAGPM